MISTPFRPWELPTCDRSRIARFGGPRFPLLLRTLPFELLDSLAKPTRPGGFQFFLCAQAIERVNCVSFDIESNVPTRNPLTTAIPRDEAHHDTLATREHILFAAVIRAGR